MKNAENIKSKKCIVFDRAKNCNGKCKGLASLSQKQHTFSKHSNENAGHLASPGFSGCFYFAVCGGVFCAFPYDRGLFSVIFLHFAQKYRCVPKIGFSADISIDILVDILLTF